MNCIIDIGNTKTKIYLFKGNSVSKHFTFFNEESNAIEETFNNLTFENGIISSSALIPAFFNHPKLVLLTNKLTLPITLNYKTPETLGTDRIALAVGANYLYPNKNVLVISAGTCITIDFIDKNGCFQGGIITPGFTIRLQSLHAFTKKLPLLDYPTEQHFPLIGKSTKESMQSGIFNGMIAEISQTIAQFEHIYKDLTILLTGGDTILFELHLKNKIFAHQNLQAMGLNHILLSNAR